MAAKIINTQYRLHFLSFLSFCFFWFCERAIILSSCAFISRTFLLSWTNTVPEYPFPHKGSLYSESLFRSYFALKASSNMILHIIGLLLRRVAQEPPPGLPSSFLRQCMSFKSNPLVWFWSIGNTQNVTDDVCSKILAAKCWHEVCLYRAVTIDHFYFSIIAMN